MIDLDDVFGTGNIQFKIRVENVSISTLNIEDPSGNDIADDFRHYSFNISEISNQTDSINSRHLKK